MSLNGNNEREIHPFNDMKWLIMDRLHRLTEASLMSL